MKTRTYFGRMSREWDISVGGIYLSNYSQCFGNP